VGMSEAVRHKFGEDILAKAMAHDAATASEPCIVIEFQADQVASAGLVKW
jgi:hypothetical protein